MRAELGSDDTAIRGGANRKVLDAIEETQCIFEAWSDEG